MNIIKELIAAILGRCPKCWTPLASITHWIGFIEGYAHYYCPKCSGVPEEERQDIYS